MPRLAALGWLVFVELPADEAYAPLYATIARTGWLLFWRLLAWHFLPACSSHAKWWCRSRHCAPAPRGSAVATSVSAFRSTPVTKSRSLPISSMTWPEGYRDSYADLEKKVESRTHELARSVSELRALGEVSQAVNSTLDLENVLTTIVAKAVQLSGTEAGSMYVFDDAATGVSSPRELRHGSGDDSGAKGAPIAPDDPRIGAVFAQREPIQVPDLSVMTRRCR